MVGSLPIEMETEAKVDLIEYGQNAGRRVGAAIVSLVGCTGRSQKQRVFCMASF